MTEESQYLDRVADMATVEKEAEIVWLAKAMVHNAIKRANEHDPIEQKRGEVEALETLKKMAIVVASLDCEPPR